MSNKLANSVSLFRVSPDSKFLDLMIDCPKDYLFTSFILNIWLPSTNETKSFDLSEAIFADDDNNPIIQNHWIVRIPLEDLGITEPAMYYATLKSEYIGEGDQTPLITELVASDVNYAYQCMLEEILKLDKCSTLSDDMIRKYLLLYGHQSAMFVNHDETAKEYFKLISNCFGKCPTSVPKGTSSCGCGK